MAMFGSSIKEDFEIENKKAVYDAESSTSMGSSMKEELEIERQKEIDDFEPMKHFADWKEKQYEAT